MEKKFYKNRKNSMLFGVCSGLSDYFGLDVTALRILTVILAVFTALPITLMYIITGLLAPKAPNNNDFNNDLQY